ncbi:MAG TPA: asparagine synthase-related protein [Bryobacteraceae bacterium]|nr:asparagine synthase-related protein [Bryobacteraceae bacterium]
MRLICGIVQLDGHPADEQSLRAMAAAMQSPGTRSALITSFEGPAGLAVLDFSPNPASCLPHLDTTTIAADVRLDDPASLRCELGGAWASAEQEALLLGTASKFGAPGLAKVDGDFAFAAWDSRARQLICGRDAFGVRPLAYAHVPGRVFAFASFPGALLAARIVPKTIDEWAFGRQVARRFVADDCLFAGIRRLPPAHFLALTGDRFAITPYWQPRRSAPAKAYSVTRLSPEDAAHKLRGLVCDAVRCRIPAGGETGAHLSGGLDSSSIAILAARALREQGRTLHAWSFLERPGTVSRTEDETKFVAAALAQENDIDWTPIPPAPVDAVLNGALDDRMSPLDPAEPENAVCRSAQAKGVGVILSGWGGDECVTFNGRGVLAEFFLRGQWGALRREIRALRRGRPGSAARNTRQIWTGILSSLLPEEMVSLLKRMAGRHPGDGIDEFLSAAARKKLETSPAWRPPVWPDAGESRRSLITSPHIAWRLENWAAAGARHGLAYAFPLLDRRVVEFALSLPAELCLRDGTPRQPFRDAMEGILPEHIRTRPSKYAPFPGRLAALADAKPDILASIDSCARVEAVARLMNLPRFRRCVELIPARVAPAVEPPRAVFPTIGAGVVLSTLRAARWLAQQAEPPARTPAKR